MILTRTPFRIPLGGGSTDLPSYYENYGGFIFGVAINMHVYIGVQRLKIDDKIRFQYGVYEAPQNLLRPTDTYTQPLRYYSAYEIVDSADELQHPIGREALRLVGIEKGSLDVVFKAGTPAGTGLGSSGSYAVGLLNALYALRGDSQPPEILAEQAFKITQRLGWEDGKQDPYLAAFGGFTVLNIEQDGRVQVKKPKISDRAKTLFLQNTLLFYTGLKRVGSSMDILKEQGQKKVLALKHRTKDIGIAILKTFEARDLRAFGLLMDEHWQVKKQMSGKISSDRFDFIYEVAKENGALGGKLIGAGGGGYFLLYSENDARDKVRQVLSALGLREIQFDVDEAGTQVLLNMK